LNTLGLITRYPSNRHKLHLRKTSGRVEQHPPADNCIPDSNKFRKQHFHFEKMQFFIAHGVIFVI